MRKVSSFIANALSLCITQKMFLFFLDFLIRDAIFIFFVLLFLQSRILSIILQKNFLISLFSLLTTQSFNLRSNLIILSLLKSLNYLKTSS